MKMRMMVFASAALLALGACSGGHKDEEVLTDNSAATNVVAPESNETAPLPAAPVVDNAANSELPAPPPAFSDQQQTRDDADASGLTARLPAEDAQPSQDGNQVRQGE